MGQASCELIIAIVSVSIWVYLIAFRGGFWWPVRGKNLALTTATSPPLPSVVAIIPARNEAAVIDRAVTSLLKQDYGGSLHIVVIDDHSSDDTWAKARAASAAAAAADRVTIEPVAPMPPGWTGKLWAIRRGAEIAGRWQPDYLLLTDADIVHATGNVRELVTRAEHGGYDLVSLMVRLHCEGCWECLLIPAFVFFFFMLYPPRWVADSTRKIGAAAGGCIMLRRQTFDNIGGVDPIRHEIIDDCALARRAKSLGRIWLGCAEHTRSVRAYGSWRPIVQMISRCAFAELGYSAAVLAACLAFMAVTFLAPPLLVFSGIGPSVFLGAALWLAMSLAYVPILREYRVALPVAVLLPAIALVYMAATVVSAIEFWNGRGGQWKGRFFQRDRVGVPDDLG